VINLSSVLRQRTNAELVTRLSGFHQKALFPTSAAKPRLPTEQRRLLLGVHGSLLDLEDEGLEWVALCLQLCECLLIVVPRESGALACRLCSEVLWRFQDERLAAPVPWRRRAGAPSGGPWRRRAIGALHCMNTVCRALPHNCAVLPSPILARPTLPLLHWLAALRAWSPTAQWRSCGCKVTRPRALEVESRSTRAGTAACTP